MRITMLAIVALSCGTGKGSPLGEGETVGDDGDDGWSSDCTVEVISSLPASGDSDFFVGDDLSFTLNEADNTAWVVLTDSSGGGIDGTATLDDADLTVVFTPSSPLTSNAAYTATVSMCDGDGSHEVSFTTRDIGDPIDCELGGRAYMLDMDTARVLEPAGLGGIILNMIPGEVLYGIEAQEGDTIDLIGALSDEDAIAQNWCIPSFDFPVADFTSSPYFKGGPIDTSIAADGSNIVLYDLEVSGIFAEDCSSATEGVIEAVIDIREMTDLFGSFLGTEEPDEICETLNALGAPCSECSDETEYCLQILADQIESPEWSHEIECIDTDYCHLRCEDTDCEDLSIGECD